MQKQRPLLGFFINRICPRSPTTRVHVAAGGNIIGKSFLIMAKCRGDGGEPSQRAARASVATL